MSRALPAGHARREDFPRRRIARPNCAQQSPHRVLRSRPSQRASATHDRRERPLRSRRLRISCAKSPSRCRGTPRASPLGPRRGARSARTPGGPRATRLRCAARRQRRITTVLAGRRPNRICQPLNSCSSPPTDRRSRCTSFESIDEARADPHPAGCRAPGAGRSSGSSIKWEGIDWIPNRSYGDASTRAPSGVGIVETRGLHWIRRSVRGNAEPRDDFRPPDARQPEIRKQGP